MSTTKIIPPKYVHDQFDTNDIYKVVEFQGDYHITKDHSNYRRIEFIDENLALADDGDAFYNCYWLK